MPRSTHPNPLIREAEDEQTADHFTDILGRRREVASLASAPLIEEWVKAAVRLVLFQRTPCPASHILFAFRPQHPIFQRLLDGCERSDVREKFVAIAHGDIKHPTYAPAHRLITGIDSPVFTARCGTSFPLERHLESGGILIVEGGGGSISEHVSHLILATIVMRTIQYVRTRPKPYPRVLLAMDEALNANLIGASGFEARALAECQKMGLDCHLLIQTIGGFPTKFVQQNVMANCVRHEWYYNADPAIVSVAAADLGDPSYAERIRHQQVGERCVKDGHRVFSERVPELVNPWAYPQLLERYAAESLQTIRQRPEYVTPVPQSEDRRRPTEPPDDEPDDDSPLGIV